MASREGKIKICSKMVVISIISVVGLLQMGSRTFMNVSVEMHREAFLIMFILSVLTVTVMGTAVIVALHDEKKHMQRARNQIQEDLKTRHEMGRHLQTLQALLYVEAYDEAEVYAESLFDDVKRSSVA